MAVKYDPNKDYSAAIEQAKASGASQATINRLQQERQAKIDDKYGGKEPTMYGSNQTYSQASSSGNKSAVSNAVNLHNQYTGSVADPYSGTNFHQDAINAAQGGNWDAVIDALIQRDDKVLAQGDNRGKTSAEIYAELWDLYGQQPEIPVAGGGGFSYDVSKPTFNSSYNDKIDALLNQILNREDFSYNAEDDALYQQYKTQYNREGTRAMNDTLASAAANAGGMNSYAVTAAQQANNYYAAQLGDKIPELYQLAYEMYLQDIDNQVRDLGLLQDMDNTQYSRYRDTMSDWYNDRDFAYGVYRDDVADGQWKQSFDYQASQDAIDNAFRQDQFDWTVSTDQRDYDYQVGRDTVTDAWRNEEWAHQVEQDLLAANQWQQAFDAENDQWQQAFNAQNSGGGSGGGSGGSSGGSGGGSSKDDDGYTGSGYAGNEGISEDIIREMQRAIGVTDDGKWGNNSRSVSGMTASEAYEAYRAGKLKRSSSGGGDPYADTRNNTTSSQYKGNSTGVSAKAKQIAAGLDTMRGQIGSKDGIANTLAIEIDMAGDSLSDADARWLFSYFGYDPDEWLE